MKLQFDLGIVVVTPYLKAFHILSIIIIKYVIIFYNASLCRLILFLIILGMSDDEILRAEMVAQLCMNDRTHSSLLDLISFKTVILCLW